jgi:hypothetical protein
MAFQKRTGGQGCLSKEKEALETLEAVLVKMGLRVVRETVLVLTTVMGDGTCDEGRAVKDIRLLSESALEKVVLTVKDAPGTYCALEMASDHVL